MAADETRDRLLDAGERLLGRLGYSKTTMEDLAREAGVSKRTIYLHFPGKEEAMLSTIDRIVERLVERLKEAAESGGSAAERIRTMLRLRVMFRFDSVRDYHQGIDELFRAIRPAYMARRARYFAAESEVFARVVAEGSAGGELDVDDAQAVARDMILATNALLPSVLSPRELGERDAVAQLAERIANLVVDGVRRRGPPAR